MNEAITKEYRLALAKLDTITRELDKRQKENGIKYYIPNKIQFYAHRSKARIVVYCAGNRAGKSTLGAVELALAMTKEYPGWFPQERRFYGPVKAVVVVTEYPIVERMLEGKILSFLPKKAIKKIKRTPQGYLSKIFCNDGSTIDILTSEMDTMAFESADWDFYWGDEPQKEDKYKAIMRGLVDRMGKGILTFTPLIEPWMKEQICDKADGKRYELFTADIRDNKFDIKGNPILTEEAIRAFEEALDKEEQETRIHGRFFHLQGIIYKEFSNVHCLDWEYQYPDPAICVIDPHDRLPHHVIWAFTDKTDDIFVDDEIIVKGNLLELAGAIKAREHFRGYKMIKRLIDPNFGAKPAKVGGVKTVKEELGKYGVNCGFANDNKETGHLKVKERLHYNFKIPIDAFNKPKLFFHKVRCPKTIHSMQNYQYDEFKDKARDSKEKPRQKDTHGADVVRYLVMDNNTYHGARTYEYDLEGAHA